jgi:hypothetical protein
MTIVRLITVNELVESHFPQLSHQLVRYHISRRDRNGLCKCIYIHREKIWFKEIDAVAWFTEYLNNKKNKNFLR